MSKAERIRALHAEGKSSREIAELVGCARHVRAVRSGCRARNDATYRAKPDVRERIKAQVRVRNLWRYHNDPTYKGGKLWRLARREASA